MPLLDSFRWRTATIPYPVLMPQREAIGQDEKAAEDRSACEHPACGRLKPGHAAREWRRLEGQWMCSSACWSSMLRQRIEREISAWKVGRSATHSHRVPLGLLLLSMGWITEGQLQAALEAQRKAKQGRIGDWLRRETTLTEREITRALAMQWNCPIFDLAEYRPQPVEIPGELMGSYRFLPLPARGRNVLFLAFESGVDAIASYAVQHVTGMRVEAGLTAEEAFRDVWTRSLGLESGAAATVPVETSDELYDAAASVLRASNVSDARLARLHRHLWLRVFYVQQDRGGSAQYRDHLYLLPPRASASSQ
jgi:hypothetical protein